MMALSWAFSLKKQPEPRPWDVLEKHWSTAVRLEEFNSLPLPLSICSYASYLTAAYLFLCKTWVILH